MTDTSRTSYDEVPYISNPVAQSHPDRLATIATLLGLKPPPVDKCRVLELGCASGGNLIPMALSLAESTYLGMDSSQVQIAEGQDVIRSLALRNIELRKLDIRDCTSALGQFDYIIAHGVYSWVPAEVQRTILQICKQSLSANGVAYISYNTYPGWHLRGMLRDMLVYHARQFAEPKARVRQARNLLDFLAKSVSSEKSPYSMLLKSEVESIRRRADSNIYHDHLEEVNEPVYFYQFVERATAAGLQYLGEAELPVMVVGNFPPEIESVLLMLAQDNIRLEQYMDFLRNRMFRQTLLCHEHQKPNYALRGEQLVNFQAASPMKAVGPAPAENGSMKFEGRSSVTLDSSDPLMQSAVTYLSELWPGFVPFRQLTAEARRRVQREDASTLASDQQALGQSFLTVYASASTNLLELSLYPPRFAATVSEKPTASPLARLQAKTKNAATNCRHEPVLLSSFGQQVLQRLDGTRRLDDVAEELLPRILNGELAVQQEPVGVEMRIKQDLLEAVACQVQSFANSALLVE